MEVYGLENNVPGPFFRRTRPPQTSYNSTPAMIHAGLTSDARNGSKTPPRAPQRHTRRPLAEHSRAHLTRARFDPHPTTPEPLKRSHREMRQSMSGLVIASKNCSRNVLPMGEQQVSTEEALPARDKQATLRPHRARCHRFEVRGVLRTWCVRYGTGYAATRAPYSLPHFYTYTLTCISLMTVTRMDTTSVCRGGALRPPRYR